uniref:DNA polymerase lambda n=1 Tax=Branchiostoma floridae TaxID=7739 RepID=C3YIS5_BRAFL|eukprot:XP_002603788.1 hypothetical protein BRAFLDRAFT_59678 [Branchiostoma floridae]
MAAPRRKKARIAETEKCEHRVLFPETNIFIVDRKMTKARHDFLQALARRKGFAVCDQYGSAVTHIVAEDLSTEQELLTMEWFTRSMEEKQPVPCTDNLRLKPTQAAVPVSTEKMTMPKHECQRITRLKHHNHRFTDILEDGYSQEVQDICDGDFYGTMQLFTGIFGVGSATARKWYERGFRTLDDIRNDSTLSLKKDQTIGLELYQDLNTPVTLAEADIIQEMVRAEVQKLLPGATVVLTGGFRRGKTKGHDVDLLISHPTEGKETGLLSAVLAKLREKDLLAYETTSANTYDPSSVSRKEYTLDHFERCFSIFNSPDLLHHEGKVSLERAGGTAGFLDGEKTEEKTWIGRRVDLIIAPASQYAYALVGWTGSKHFNRSLRLYADNEMNMKLTNHVLYDSVKNQYLPASSEEDVFLHLQLPYREPAERNC